MIVTHRSAPRYKQDLFGFWKLLNLLQLLPHSSWCSRNGLGQLEQETIEVFSELISSVPVLIGSGESSLWDEQLEYTVISGELELLRSSGLPVALNGYDIKNEASELVAEAEFAWPDYKVVLLTEEQQEYVKTLETLRWHCFVEPVDETLIEQFKGLIGTNNNE